MQGKTIILLASAIGLGLGALSVVYHHSLGRRAIGWWGPADMELIAYAPRVDALKISPTQGDAKAEGEPVTIDSQKYRVERRQDVTQWPGIDHVRHGLLQDVNFNWDGKSRRSNEINWKYALEFIDGDRRLIVVFSQDDSRTIGSNRHVDDRPKGDGLARVFLGSRAVTRSTI